MKAIIDRIEEDIVVCELEIGNVIDINKKWFNFKIKEGDVVDITQKIIPLPEETEKRKKYIEELTKDLWEE